MAIFLNEDYENYKYLVECSDNYYCLAKKSIINGSWDNPVEYDVVYQYIIPSTLVIEGTRTTSQRLYFNSVEINNDFWSRADSPKIFSCSILLIFCSLWILNILTRIVKRGGILH